MALSKNPNILLSIINTKLRDTYSSLDELCDDLDAEKSEIETILSTIGCKYSPKDNQFKIS